jgi:hypothetical protein
MAGWLTGLDCLAGWPWLTGWPGLGCSMELLTYLFGWVGLVGLGWAGLAGWLAGWAGLGWAGLD